MRKKVNFLDGALVAAMAVLLLAFGIGVLLGEQQSFSEEENRGLATWRMPTVKSVSDGTFSEELGRVYRDQFPLRRVFIAGKAYGELFLGKRENNRVLWGEDGYLMARNEYTDLSIAEENLRSVEKISDARRVWIPRSSDVMIKQLPHAYPSGAASRVYRLLDGNGVIPLKKLQDTAEQGTQVYYRTDHHMTTEGAYLVYLSLGEVLGFTPVERAEFVKQTVSENFLGSADSAVGGIAPRADTIELFRYEDDGEFWVTDQTTGEVRGGFYDWTALARKDQYQVFLGGNFAHLTVEREGSEMPRLLLVKDSFANAIVPFLAIHFDLEIIDLRYVSDEVTVEKYDQILILQGIDTLATDPSLKKITLIKQKS